MIRMNNPFNKLILMGIDDENKKSGGAHDDDRRVS